MRYVTAELHAKEDSEQRDLLGNTIKSDKLIGTFLVRKSLWSSSEQYALPREITANEIKFVTQAKKSFLQKGDFFLYGEQSFEITNLLGEDFDRWRVIYAKGYMNVQN